MASVRGSTPCLPGCECGRHNRPRQMLTCETCGVEVPRRGKGKKPPQRFCSLPCRDVSYRSREPLPASADCGVCGRVFSPKWSTNNTVQKFCSLACRNLSYRRDPHLATCEQCGVEFVNRWAAASRPRRFCSMACHQASQRLIDKVPRRKALLGVYREPYAPADIAARDGWRCGLCGKKVNPTAKHPHPGSASIDHLVPISQGGPDTPANVQLAHLSCNLSKGTRAMGEQLRLIG